MALPLLNHTQLERISFRLSESAPPPVKREKRIGQPGEKSTKGTWLGRVNKTAQDRIKLVSDRPRFQAWASRIDTAKASPTGARKAA
jgi:hypothetical protein